MQVTVCPPLELRGRVDLPASKSISNRALIIYALSREGEAFGMDGLGNVSDCDDTRVMVDALTRNPEVIDILAAGTAMRFLSAYLSVSRGTHILTGTERMRHRPIGILVDALRRLGAEVEYVENEGFPPLRIKGMRDGKNATNELALPGDVSSQYISALLMVGPVLKDGLRLRLTGSIVSRPYIEMTLGIMRRFGAQVAWESACELTVSPGGYRRVPYCVENDWSASSYWYEMVALSPKEDAEVVLPNLFEESLQGDCAVRDIFRHLGVETEFWRDEDGLEGIRISKKGKPVERLEYDFVNQPDLAQTLVVTCALMGIPFRFSGLQSLKIKETDRLVALRTELRKLGYPIEETEGRILSWEGERTEAEEHPVIETYEDHRMAMSLVPACLKVGSVQVNNPEVVSKSYPRFWNDLERMGFGVKKS